MNPTRRSILRGLAATFGAALMGPVALAAPIEGAIPFRVVRALVHGDWKAHRVVTGRMSVRWKERADGSWQRTERANYAVQAQAAETALALGTRVHQKLAAMYGAIRKPSVLLQRLDTGEFGVVRVDSKMLLDNGVGGVLRRAANPMGWESDARGRITIGPSPELLATVLQPDPANVSAWFATEDEALADLWELTIDDLRPRGPRVAMTDTPTAEKLLDLWASEEANRG